MMSSSTSPSVHLLSRSNLNHDCFHSVVISVLRGLAAIQVAAAHIRAQFYPGLSTLPDPSLWYQVFAFATGFAHQAVVVFFLLSGWLVGGALLNKYHEKNALLFYGIDRLTRLWIVLIPSFLLSLFLASLAGDVGLSKLDFALSNEFSATAFIGNLFGLQDMWVPRYAGNFALWSLANETWYYILLPLIVLPFFAKSVAAKVFGVLSFLALMSFLSFAIALFFIIWLLGVGASRIQVNIGPRARLMLLFVLLGLSAYFRITGNNDKLEPVSFFQDFLLSVLFLALLCSLQFKPSARGPLFTMLKKWGAGIAAFSFTLYVIHVPLIFAARDLIAKTPGSKLSPDNPLDFVIYMGLLSLIVGFAYLFHLPFEAQTVRVRNWLKDRMLRPAPLPSRTFNH
jgi:peptidoglycan/LPS O-acetylase OafA/YrhL